MTAPVVKGWCPGAHRPMLSGDGLVVRVRPFRGEFAATQALALCDLALRFGNGTLDLTSRGNLQIRGVSGAEHPSLLQELDALGLIDADPLVEGHRNIIVAPDRRPGDLTDRLCQALLDTLPALPALPEKMGVVLDTGASAVLGFGSGDFRFEMTDNGGLILRADGATAGRPIAETGAMEALSQMAGWFVATGGPAAGRMMRHLRRQPLPPEWQRVVPRASGPAPEPGRVGKDWILGAPFGSLHAQALAALLRDSGASALRPMLARLFRLCDARSVAQTAFVTTPGSQLLQVHACPGAPFCPQATVETRALATRLAPSAKGTLHVSGCTKGCALQRPAGVTLVGRDGAFDLVRNGTAADPPLWRGIDPSHFTDLIGMS